MVRHAHRTTLGRLLAACLLLLAVSPVTAPFTTCDVADFMHSLSHDSAPQHPGRQMAVAACKIAPHILTVALTSVAVGRVEARDGQTSRPLGLIPIAPRHGLRTILRL